MPISYRYPRRSTYSLPKTSYDDGQFGQVPIGRIGGFAPFIEVAGHYTRSSRHRGKDKRIDVRHLRALADTYPAQVCISRIVDGVLGMTIEVNPPPELKNDPKATAKAHRIKSWIQKPNIDEQPTYSMFVSSIIHDFVVGNVAAIERAYIPIDTEPKEANPPDDNSRQEGVSETEDAADVVDGDEEADEQGDIGKSIWIQRKQERKQEIWQWCVDYDRIQLNTEWTPQNAENVPRYYDRGPNKSSQKDKWVPLYDWDMYVIQRYANSWRRNFPSAMEIAYELITNWLGLNKFQSQTTSNATQEYLIDLGPATEDELRMFREFFRSQVMGSGEIPVIASKGEGLNVVKMGAATDEGLYLKYEEKMLRLIALAFKLSSRDMNITEPDNRATAGVAADASFQSGILPIANAIIESLQTHILDFYFPGYVIRYTDSEPRNEADEAATASTLFEKNIITLNEARVRVGEEKDFTDRGNKYKSELEPSAATNPQGEESPADSGKPPSSSPGNFGGKSPQKTQTFATNGNGFKSSKPVDMISVLN